jgi:hypothetical protein
LENDGNLEHLRARVSALYQALTATPTPF